MRVSQGRAFAARTRAPYTRNERALGLTEGFESAYRQELLATVHRVALYEYPAIDPDLVAQVRSWSQHKAGMFTADRIHAALDALRG